MFSATSETLGLLITVVWLGHYLNSSMRIAILGGVIEQRNTQDGFAGLCDTMTGSDTRISGSGLGWDSVQTLVSLSWDTDKVTGAFDRKQFDV